MRPMGRWHATCWKSRTRRHDGLGRRHPQATHGRRAARNPAPAAGSRLLWADTNYVLEGDAYLYFANLDEDYRIRKFIWHFDGLLNGDGGDVAFRGPLTREEFLRKRQAERTREWREEVERESSGSLQYRPNAY